MGTSPIQALCGLLLTGVLGFAGTSSAFPVVYPLSGGPAETTGTVAIAGTMTPTAAITGSVTENAVPAGSFSAATARATGQCQVQGGVLCGPTFGGMMNLTAVPGPTSALLLGFAVGGLWLARRGNP